MAHDEMHTEERIRLAHEAREQALSLLDRLHVDRRHSEDRLTEAGKRDPLKFLTGSSALDRAIDSTREMIGHMDDLLVQLQAELKAEGAGYNGTPTGEMKRPACPARPMVSS